MPILEKRPKISKTPKNPFFGVLGLIRSFGAIWPLFGVYLGPPHFRSPADYRGFLPIWGQKGVPKWPQKGVIWGHLGSFGGHLGVPQMTLFGGMAQKCPIISRTFKMGPQKGSQNDPKKGPKGSFWALLALFGGPFGGPFSALAGLRGRP
jgi:hypothetical protein